MTAHWGIADPAAVSGDAEAGAAFRQALGELEARVKQLVRLPIESLDREALQRALGSIGQTTKV